MPDAYGDFSTPQGAADPYGQFASAVGQGIQKVGGWMDSALAGAGGLAQAALNTLPAAMPVLNNPLGAMTATAAGLAANAVAGKLGIVPQQEANRREAQLIASGAQAATAPNSGQQITQALKTATGFQDYQPTTAAGRLVKNVAVNAPNALVGGAGLIPKAAAVVLPGVLGDLGAEGVRALGGDQGAQDLANGVLGTVGGVGAGAIGGIGSSAGALTPEEAPVANAVSKALNLGQSTPESVQAGLDRGILPVATSPGLAGLGEAVASTPGPAQVLLRDAIAQRMGTQTDRALGAVQDTLGVAPAAARGDVGSIVQAGQAAAAPLYKAALSTTAPIWNTDLAELAQRPAIQKAMNVAATGLLNRGQNPRTLGFALDPDTGWTIPADADGSLFNVEQQPTAELWDRTYKALGQTVERSPITNRVIPNSLSPNNADVSAAGGDLRTILAGDPANGVPAAIPGYGDALKTSSDYLSVQNAFDRASGKLFNGKVSDFSDLWNSLKTAPEQDAARSALANDVLEASDRSGFNPGKFRAPGVQKKLSLAFGDDAANQFVNQMESDANERETYNTITGNSRTTPRAALISEYQNAPPPGILGLAQKGVGALKWGQALLTAPHMLPAMIMDSSLRNATAKAGTLPWEDPDTAAQLGGVLGDPAQMTTLLGKISAQKQAAVAASTANRYRLLASAPTAGFLSYAPSPGANDQR